MTLEMLSRDIGQVRRFSPPEEAAVVARRDGGDPAARRELIERHIPLAVGLARPAGRRYPSHRDDFLGVALAALVVAADGFRAGEGCRFGTYATAVIRDHVNDYALCRMRPIRVPEAAASSARAARAGRAVTRGSFRPSAALVAAAARAMDCVPSGDAAWEAHLAAPGPGDALESAELVQVALGALTPIQAAVLRARFGLDGRRPLGAVEAAAALGRTRQNVHQVEARALRALRAAVEALLGEGGRP